MRDPRLSEASPAELIDAFLRASGWDVGRWLVEVESEGGAAVKWYAKESGGRNALLERRRDGLESGAT